MTKQATVELLKQQLPGFYSVEQVINIINGIEDSSEGFNEEKQQNLKDLLLEKVSSCINRLDGSDVADYDSAEFELNDKELSLYSIDVNTDSIADEVENAIDAVFNEVFETVEA